MRRQWHTRRLGELLSVQSGFAFPSDRFNDQGRGVPLIRIRDLSANATNTFYDDVYNPDFMVAGGDYLIGMDGEFRCYMWRGPIGLLNQRVCRLRDFRPDVIPKFVYYGINKHLAGIEERTDYVTVKHISAKQIAQIKMPLPPLSEQERIVKILDAADELRKLRQQADRRTADLIPAIFHDMFGDPATNPKGWPVKPLNQVVEINPRLSKTITPCPDELVTFVPMAAIDQDRGLIANAAEKEYSEVSKGYTSFKKGDVLFAKITPCMQNGKSALVDHLRGSIGFGSTEFHVLRSKDATIPEFLFGLVRRTEFRAQAERSFTGTAGQKRVPTSFLASYPCPVPPIRLQHEFAARAAEVREMETRQAESRRRLDDLFQSLLHRAFAGEL